MASRAVVEDARLTHRQRQVVAMLADGYSNREIAEALDISLDGAKWHVGEILLRLNVDSREEAAAWWLTRDQRARRSSRRFWAVALALPWKLAAGIAGVFGGSSRLRPHVQTDEAALLRDTAVSATWEPPPPPSIVASTDGEQVTERASPDNGRHEFVVPETKASVDRPEADERPDGTD